MKRHALLLLMLMLIGVMMGMGSSSAAAQEDFAATVTGRAFLDYNYNGVLDTGEAGLGGVTVTLTTNTGATTNATTAFDGSYTINAAGTSARVEFIPPTTLGVRSTIAGASTVQFRLTNGGTVTVNAGFIDPATYTPPTTSTSPVVYVPLHVAGDPTAGGTTASAPALLRIPVAARFSTGQTPTLLNPASQLGATWGMAYDQANTRLFTGAVLRRGAGALPFGGSDAGLGRIFRLTNLSGTPSVSLFVNANTLPGVNVGTVARTLTPNNTDPQSDNAAYTQVGRIGLGGIGYGNGVVYAMNLNQRTLLEINASTGALVAARDVTSGITCTGGTFRPWAVKYHLGQAYIGGVCDASTSGSAADLRVIVRRFNGTSFDTLLNEPLVRSQDAWRAWGDYPISPNSPGASYCQQPNGSIPGSCFFFLPQPIFGSIEFARDGTMTLGFIDRFALALGRGFYSPTTGLTNYIYLTENRGDILRACATATTTFALEGNAACPRQYGVEHYLDSTIGPNWSHNETAMGGLASLFRDDKLISTGFDPRNVSSAGLFFYDRVQADAEDPNASPTRYENDRVVLYAGSNFSKSGGLGDLELLTQAPPIEIGNRVWFDLDGDGIQDANEQGASNVQVELRTGGGSLVDNATTDSNGDFAFSSWAGTTTGSRRYNLNLTAGNTYNIRVNYGALNSSAFTYSLSPANQGGNDRVDSDAIEGTAGDGFSEIALVMPNTNDHTFDTGLVPEALAPVADYGDLPDTYGTTFANGGAFHVNLLELGAPFDNWLGTCIADADNPTVTNGVPTANALGDDTGGADSDRNGNCAAGADDEDGVVFPSTPMVAGNQACIRYTVTGYNGPDPELGTFFPVDIDVKAWIDFNQDGTFSGNDADYAIQTGNPVTVNPPYTPVTNTECFTVPATAVFEGGLAYGRVRTGATNSPVGQGINGEVEDYRADLACAGNRLWSDLDNDGVQDTGEPGVNGVAVRLRWAGADGTFGTSDDVTYTVNTATNPTNSQAGYYEFCGLTRSTNNYRVELPTVPTGYTVSPANAGGNDVLDSDVTLVSGTYQTPNFTFSLGVPTGENGPADLPTVHNYPDNQTNMTLDIGLAPPAVFDWGDNPDTFATLNASNGARHQLINGFFMGVCADSETNGQPTAQSTGDDAALGGTTFGTCAVAGDDENGITVVSPLVSGQEACFTYNVRSPEAGYLKAWLDTDGDSTYAGDTADALTFVRHNGVPIQPATTAYGIAASAGTSGRLCFNVPAGSTFDGGETHLRTRWYPQGAGTGVSFDGVSPTGEVEDYYFDQACLGNYIWNDTNINGIQDTGEVGINGISVVLAWAGADGTFGTSDDVTYNTTTATGGGGNAGYYQFCGLVGGYNYQVYLPQVPEGYEVTLPNVGGNDSLDSDGAIVDIGGLVVVGIPSFNVPSPIALTTGENGTGDVRINNYPDSRDLINLDIGLYAPLACVGNFLWNDANMNGIQDVGEIGLNGIETRLISAGLDGIFGTSDDVIVATTTTATGPAGNDGYYQFCSVPEGTYNIRFITLPSAAVESPLDAGSDDDLDNECVKQGPDFVIGATYAVLDLPEVLGENGIGDGATTVPDAVFNESLDCGYRIPQSADDMCIGNEVWIDASGNGLQDTGETGLNGVGVTVTNGVTFTAFITTATANGGQPGWWQICGVEEGIYTITYDIPTGYTLTTPNANPDVEDLDSDCEAVVGGTVSYTHDLQYPAPLFEDGINDQIGVIPPTYLDEDVDDTADCGLIPPATAVTVMNFDVAAPTSQWWVAIVPLGLVLAAAWWHRRTR